MIIAAPHVATIADSLPEPVQLRLESESAQNEEKQELPIEDTMDPISLLPPWEQTTAPSPFRSESKKNVTNNNDSASTNPGYVDFVNGFNNHRNESPPARRVEEGFKVKVV